MQAFVESFTLVALAEMGDKTQLLSIILAARYRKFWPIVLGILVATSLNHGIVAWLGSNMDALIDQATLKLVISLLFIAVGIWALIPDKEPQLKTTSTAGAFMASCIAFFIAEMGDKTQLATLTLGAQHPETSLVIIGTTFGMLAANVPAVLFGETLLKKIPLPAIRMSAAALFFIFGIMGIISWYRM
jgi:putative Ca2+/H+ antiporter (TMEM165/GDT1 family)